MGRFESWFEVKDATEPQLMVKGQFIAIAKTTRIRVDFEFSTKKQSNVADDAFGGANASELGRRTVVVDGSKLYSYRASAGLLIPLPGRNDFETLCNEAGFPFRNPCGNCRRVRLCSGYRKIDVKIAGDRFVCTTNDKRGVLNEIMSTLVDFHATNKSTRQQSPAGVSRRVES
jgi:hypothetical protein